MKGLLLILKEAEVYVRALFKEHSDPKLVYHNLQHTTGVVKHAAEIALHYHLSSTEHFILMTAAWFHDTGHLVHTASGHEMVSAQLMREHLSTFDLDKKMIALTEECIMDTRFPSDPQTLAGQILCDADLYHLGTGSFVITNELVRQELELRNNITLQNWDALSLAFLEQHNYFTSYCKLLLDEGKVKNINLLKALPPGT